MTGFGSDCRHALRSLRSRPGFALAVVVALALGIGATTAIYGFIDGILLHPLPYPHEERLLAVCETHADMPDSWCGASPGNVNSWSEASGTIEFFGLGRRWSWTLQRGGRLEGVSGGVASSDLFPLFGARTERGRLLTAADSAAGATPVAMLSYAFWRSRFGGDPGLLGESILLDGQPTVVVGVLPSGFEVPGLEGVQVWIPIWPESADARWWRGFRSFGRLAPGASLAQARAEMATVRDALAAAFPEDNAAWGLTIDSLRERTVRPVRPALMVFLGGVLLLLLVSCANVASLMLARQADRGREMAVRSALGAGTWSLMRRQLVEAVLLAAAGGALGALLAGGIVRLLLRLAPADLPRLEEVGVDLRVLAFAAALSACTVVLFGLVPTWRAGRPDLDLALGQRSPASADRATSRLRQLLVVAQVALALLLVTGAGLLTRSFANLTHWQPGFERRGLVAVQVFPPVVKYADGAQIADVLERVVERLRATPGVTAASFGSAVPLRGGDGVQEYLVEGLPEPPAGKRPTVAWFDVAPGYFRTLGIPLLHGRAPTAADGRDAPPVAVVNETFARRHWPPGEAVGRRVRLLDHEASVEIVGVVGDVLPFRPDEATPAALYWPFRQFPRGAAMVVVRVDGKPEAAVPALRAALTAVDPDLELGAFTTMDELADRELVRPRFTMVLVGVFALLALLVAAVGTSGLISYGVARRRAELGLRLALGARRRQVRGLVLRQGLALGLGGLAIGMLLSLALSRLLGDLLVEVEPADPLTLAVACVLLTAVVAAASWLPARRAARMDPTEALRDE